MSSKASIFHHPIHPMSVSFPLGLWFTSFICDGLYAIFPKYVMLREMAFWLVGGGVIGAAIAAVPGLVDYFFIRDDPKVRGTATLHMMLNSVVLLFQAANFILRYQTPTHLSKPALALSVVDAMILSTSAWLGHTLVYHYGVGVEPAKKAT